jgi:uncharacterized phiE125 gp8 family phage protein
MKLELVTAPTSDPVDLLTAKIHLRIELDAADEDEYLEGLITAAREQVEDITRRKLLTQTWDYSLDGWPRGTSITLPFGNLQSVTSVKWKDTAGTETTLTLTTDYLVETNGEQPGRIVLPYGGTWPTGTLYPSNPITVRYVCGWTAATLVPSKVRSAILMLVAKLYESRGEDMVGQTVVEDKSVERLLASARLWDELP